MHESTAQLGLKGVKTKNNKGQVCTTPQLLTHSVDNRLSQLSDSNFYCFCIAELFHWTSRKPLAAEWKNTFNFFFRIGENGQWLFLWQNGHGEVAAIICPYWQNRCWTTGTWRKWQLTFDRRKPLSVSAPCNALLYLWLISQNTRCFFIYALSSSLTANKKKVLPANFQVG